MIEGYADIEGPVRTGLLELFAVVGASFLAVLLLVSLLLFILWKKKQGAGNPDVTIRSPLEIALERLERLRTEAAQMEADPFIIEVSDIVRDYLETALEIPAREQTSEEFLQTVQLRDDMPAILKTRMPQFLDQCDLVKFARQVLAASQRQDLLETAGIVVGETDASLCEPEERSLPKVAVK